MPSIFHQGFPHLRLRKFLIVLMNGIGKYRGQYVAREPVFCFYVKRTALAGEGLLQVNSAVYT